MEEEYTGFFFHPKEKGGKYMIDQETIDLANQVDILKIPAYFDYGITNHNKIKCPLHEENDPSCSYYALKNTFHCFSCGENFDCIRLYRELSYLDDKPVTFQEAVQDVLEIGEMEFEAKTAGVSIEREAYIGSDELYEIILNNCKPMQGYEVNYLCSRGIFLDGGFVYQGKGYTRKNVFWHIENAKDESELQFWNKIKDEGTYYKGISSSFLRQNFLKILHNYYNKTNFIIYNIDYEFFVSDRNAERNHVDFDGEPREMIIQKSMDETHTKRNAGETNFIYLINGVSDKAEDIFVTEGIEDAFSILSMHEDSFAISLNSTVNLDKLTSAMEDSWACKNKLNWHIVFDHDHAGEDATRKLMDFFDSENQKIVKMYPNVQKKIAKANGGRVQTTVGYYNYDVYDYPQEYKDFNDYWKSIVFGK